MKAILFDLDNTLYDSKQYIFSAFRVESQYLSKKYHIPKEEIYEKLISLWKEKTSMYRHLFNDILNLFNIKNETEVKNLVNLFNKCKFKGNPYPDTISTLHKLKNKKYKLGIITDGNVERQKRKIKSLNIKSFFNVIIYAKEIESKPSSMSYIKALKMLNVKPSDTFYVADNPLIDFEGAKKVGMKTIRILRGEFKNIPKNEYVDYEVKEIKELLNVIEREKYEIK